MNRVVQITKADGTQEAFDPQKLEQSLRRAGATSSVITDIVQKITSELKEGMTTKKIYQRAFALLRRKEHTPVAAKYSLKKAVFDLGPSGFPFEDFVAEIFRARGYSVTVGSVLKGKCAEHEVDIVAHASPEKNKDSFGGEVKFHNHPGVKTDLKDALYVHARFEDLSGTARTSEGSTIVSGKLITNTKFTENAIKYGECVGLSLLAWDYPAKGNLFELIGETGLHPLTCLTTLPKRDAKRLLENKIVLCRSVKSNPSILEEFGVSRKKIPDILNEISALCQPGAGV